MTNEQAFAEFQYAVNHWFKFMDKETRENAARIAIQAIQSPIGEVQHRIVQHVSGESNRFKVDGRGAHLRKFAGKAWMLNRETGERIRIDPSSDEVGTYVARGFVKAGPRSK